METLDLSGCKGLVVGVANADSPTWSAARHFASAGAELALTYGSDKATPFVGRRAEQMAAHLLLPCNVTVPGQLEAAFEAIRERWGRLDFIFHSIASARKEDQQLRLNGCSNGDFAEAMLVSCHSLIRMTRLATPLMTEGGSLTTLSYYGDEKVIDHYCVKRPVKAALEASVRYLAQELRPRNIRVNAISAEPEKARVTACIKPVDESSDEGARKALQRRVVEACEVGHMALLLASPYTSAITGEVFHVDACEQFKDMMVH